MERTLISAVTSIKDDVTTLLSRTFVDCGVDEAQLPLPLPLKENEDLTIFESWIKESTGNKFSLV